MNYPEVQYDEDLEEAVFLCPYSKTNIFKWEEDGFPEIPELVIYTNNLSDTFEDAHVNKTLRQAKQDFKKIAGNSWASNFEDYIIKELNPEMPYYRLILQHPDGENSDYVTVIYQGEYEN